MKKMIKTSLKTNEKNENYTVSAIINGQHLQYYENGAKMVLEFGRNYLSIRRVVKDEIIEFRFGSENTGTIHINGMSVSIPVKLVNLIINDQSIEVKYMIEEESFYYKVEF